VRRIFIGLLGALVAAGPVGAATNTVSGATNNAPAPAAVPDDAVDRELKKLMEADDDAQADVDEWIRDNDAAAARGAALPAADMKRRIRDRFQSVREGYENFIKQHPDHAAARVAYGSFLNDLNDEDGAREQLEKALTLNSQDAAAYNNLANIYGHTGPVKKAFEYYGKAIELNSREPIYYHNFGTTVYLFRKDAEEYFHITEQEVFDKALQLYSKALKLDPTNFPLASDVAQTFYGIKPLRLEAALTAWTNALTLAHDEIEREGVYVHLARLKVLGERLPEARSHLNAITNEMYSTLKKRISHNLEEAERQAAGTNAPSKKEPPPP
jgi:tetratricopeptide (TPR) repeat protein